jgi:conjugal transfer mating pair stabilization protein TraN
MIRKLVIVGTLSCFVFAQTHALAQAHREGLEAGRAANPVIRGTITTPSATEHVPGYTTAPPERSLSGQPSLTAPANARLAACQANASDPVCQAQRGAVSSANLPREGLSPDDPALNAARAVTRNPGQELGGLSNYYTGCTTTASADPAVVHERTCHRGELTQSHPVTRDLTVDVELVPNCVAGDWFAQAQVHRIPNVDIMYAQAQCRIRTDGEQRFRFYAHGSNGACIGWQELDLPSTPLVAPLYVAPLSPNWGRQGCWDNFGVVALPGSGCTNGQCRYQFQFGTLLYGCPSDAVGGDTLVADWGLGYVGPGPVGSCFAVQESQTYPCPEGTIPLQDGYAGLRCATPAGAATVTGASGWEVPLSFLQPGMQVNATDAWVDRVPDIAAGRCTVSGEERCVDGPSTKYINGQPIHRACWRYERTVSCATGLEADGCQALARSGCTFARTACEHTDPQTGRCTREQDVYRCASDERPRTAVSNCPANVFCLGSSCFNTASIPDGDFARSMSMLEAGREAGVYLDTRSMQVFKGEPSSCRNRFLTNCCDPDMSGAGMTNQSVGIGRTRLVYDILTNSENLEFISAGLNALIGSAGFSGSFSAYGVTVAVNGTALPAGSTVLYASSSTAGSGVVVAFDPWSLVIAVIIYIVMQLLECNEQEARLALREGARLCHTVGSYCSTCIRDPIRGCISCTTTTVGKCCFNSLLARLINEQGRAQVGKGWGSARSPDCSGFTVDELQRLDFGAMDLSEFYDSLVPSLPNQDGIRERNEERLRRCSQGQGACP